MMELEKARAGTYWFFNCFDCGAELKVVLPKEQAKDVLRRHECGNGFKL